MDKVKSFRYKTNGKKNIMKDNKGMTLVELVVSIAIISVILLAIYSFLNTGVKGFARETTTANNQAQVRRISNNIGREIRRANSIAVEDDSKKLIITDPDGNIIEYTRDVTDNTIKAKHINGASSYTSNLASGIAKFTAIIVDDKVTVEIKSIENARGKTYELKTEITIRR